MTAHQMEKEMASKLEKEGTGVEGNMEEEDLPKQVRTLKSFSHLSAWII